MNIFKVRCILNPTTTAIIGKIYTVENGVLILENGLKCYGFDFERYENVEQINADLYSQFEYVNE